MAIQSLNPMYGGYQPGGEPKPNYSPTKGEGSKSSKGMWTYSQKQGWIPTETYTPVEKKTTQTTSSYASRSTPTIPTSNSYTQPQMRTPEQMVNDLLASQEEAIKRETNYLTSYAKNSPFAFDEVLAKQSAQAEYSPYYTELLDDYIKNIGVNRDTLQSESKLLDALRTTSQGTAGENTRAYTRAVARAEEGFAGQGMFFSGIKKRTLGEGEVEREYGIGQTATETLNKQRDVGREQTAAIEGGVLQRQSEAIKQYNLGMQQNYMRQFPTGNMSNLQGYLMPDYLRV